MLQFQTESAPRSSTEGALPGQSGRLFYTGEGIPKPVVMTPEERETVLQECHDYCGHRSKRSTADRVCQKYYWRTGGLTQTTGVEDGIDERIQEAEMMFDKIRQNIGKAQRKQKKDYESRHKNTNESNFHGRRDRFHQTFIQQMADLEVRSIQPKTCALTEMDLQHLQRYHAASLAVCTLRNIKCD
ncbi:hypothetical protein JZ751_018948, partial [Albula glossodonta]